MYSLLHKFRLSYNRNLGGWGTSAVIILSLLSIPVWILIYKFFNAQSDVWDHLVHTVLSDYIYNTLVIIGGVGVLTFIIGVSTAWLVTAFDFPGRNFFKWTLILPLAIPPYVAAYTYAGIFDFTSPVSVYGSEMLGIKNAFAGIMSMQNLVLILGFVMYPYVFLITRASFLQQSGNVLEASRMLGKSSTATFFKVALPMARPAIAGGLILVVMELLNDYGAMKYFGISTFTVAICQVWFSFNDLNAAIRLAICLMIFSLVLVLMERLLRGRMKFSGNFSGKTVDISRIKLTGGKAALAFTVCFLPLLLGFIVPALQLLVWAIKTSDKSLHQNFSELIYNSFSLATAAALLSVVIAVVLVYAIRLKRNRLMNTLLRAVNVGYALPGAVIAIGVMIPFIFINNTLVDSMGRDYNIQTGMFIGGVVSIVFACIVRFLALAVNPVEAGFDRVNNTIEEASKTLGSGSFH